MRYQMMDHTADAGLIVFGKTLGEVYGQAALALFDQITELETVQGPVESVELTVEGEDRVDLLVNWLREVLFLWNGREKLVTGVSVEGISRRNISATIRCVAFDPERHRIKQEIKAVTYHRAEVKRTSSGWRAVFVVDL